NKCDHDASYDVDLAVGHSLGQKLCLRYVDMVIERVVKRQRPQPAQVVATSESQRVERLRIELPREIGVSRGIDEHEAVDAVGVREREAGGHPSSQRTAH